MLGKGIKEETYKNQTAEEDEYLEESLAAEFDRISFSEEEKERIYRRVKGGGGKYKNIVLFEEFIEIL